MVINSIPPQTPNKWLANLIFFRALLARRISIYLFILVHLAERDTRVHLFQRSPPLFSGALLKDTSKLMAGAKSLTFRYQDSLPKPQITLPHDI